MKRALAAVPAAVGSLLAAVAVAPAPAGAAVQYCGANDVVYPVISRVALQPGGDITIGKANKVVTVKISARDDCEVKRLFVMLAPKGAPTNRVIYLTAFTRIGGTQSNGTWEAKKTLLDEQIGGVWQMARVEVEDTYFNVRTLFKPAGTMHLRHVTTTKLKKPKSPVKSKATLVGRLNTYHDFGTWKVQVQQRKPGKAWKKTKNLTTNAWGDFGTQVKITGTTEFRVVHFRDNTTIGSKSKTYKVKLKKK